MADIVIKIIIPQGEYEQWDEFEDGGLNGVKKDLKSYMIKVVRGLGVYDYELEVYDED